MKKIKLLIISHYFPPIPEAGSRRWAKFVKYLSKHTDEVDFHLVCAKDTLKRKVGSFQKELEEVDFKKTALDSNYPKHLLYLQHVKPTFFQKLMFRLQLRSLKKKVKGNYWDFGVLWKSRFENEISAIVKNEGIETIVISGPPFRYVRFAVDLKKKKKDLEIILDYRDPWNDFNNPFQIGEERLSYEREEEKKILKEVDKITTVSREQKELILKIEPDAAPIYLLPNGYDIDDVPHYKDAIKNNNEVRLAHFGTLNLNKEYYWKPFFQAMKRIKDEFPSLYQKLFVDLIGYCPEEINQYINEYNLYDHVMVHGVLPPDRAFDQLSRADVALWFKYDLSPGAFATKFGDYIALKKFIWCFSVKGDVTEHIKDNKIGKVFYRENTDLESAIASELKKVLEEGVDAFNEDYDSDQLSINQLTNRLIKIIND